MIILVLFLHIHRGLKILSTLLHSLYAMRIFSCRRARLSLKEAFRVIFARNCNDRGVVAASLLRQSFSLPATLSSSHLFSSLSFSLSIYLFFFATASVCGPATPRCQYRHFEIICSSAHFWARCDRNCTVKVVPSEFFIHQFLEPFRDDVLTHINSLLYTLCRENFPRKRKRRKIFIS